MCDNGKTMCGQREIGINREKGKRDTEGARGLLPTADPCFNSRYVGRPSIAAGASTRSTSDLVIMPATLSCESIHELGDRASCISAASRERDGGREGGREGSREGRREGGREARREGGKEGVSGGGRGSDARRKTPRLISRLIRCRNASIEPSVLAARTRSQTPRPPTS